MFGCSPYDACQEKNNFVGGEKLNEGNVSLYRMGK